MGKGPTPRSLLLRLGKRALLSDIIEFRPLGVARALPLPRASSLGQTENYSTIGFVSCRRAVAPRRFSGLAFENSPSCFPFVSRARGRRGPQRYFAASRCFSVALPRVRYRSAPRALWSWCLSCARAPCCSRPPRTHTHISLSLGHSFALLRMAVPASSSKPVSLYDEPPPLSSVLSSSSSSSSSSSLLLSPAASCSPASPRSASSPTLPNDLLVFEPKLHTWLGMDNGAPGDGEPQGPAPSADSVHPTGSVAAPCASYAFQPVAPAAPFQHLSPTQAAASIKVRSSVRTPNTHISPYLASYHPHHRCRCALKTHTHAHRHLPLLPPISYTHTNAHLSIYTHAYVYMPVVVSASLLPPFLFLSMCVCARDRCVLLQHHLSLSLVLLLADACYYNYCCHCCCSKYCLAGFLLLSLVRLHNIQPTNHPARFYLSFFLLCYYCHSMHPLRYVIYATNQKNHVVLGIRYILPSSTRSLLFVASAISIG